MQTKSTSLLSLPWIVGITISIVIRLILHSLQFGQVFERQIEFTTPTTSFRRLVEGLHLISFNLSPYSSTMFIQPPLILLPFLPFVSKTYFLWYARLLYIGLDVVITWLLFNIAKIHKENVSADPEQLTFDNPTFRENLPHIIAAFYLFNPVIIMSNISLSTVIFSNATLAATVYFALKGNYIYVTLALSLATYISVLPVILMIPVILMVARRRNANVVAVGVKVTILFGFWLGLWTFLSYSMTGDSWDFVQNAYVYPLTISDLTPNWSNFWYMFTEVFDHFRKFFLLVFHVHMLGYIVPITIQFYNDPTFLCFIFIAMISVFKAYATFGDISFYITLLMMYSHLTKHMRYGFFISVLMTYGMIIGPACFRTWIYKGTGNANFFYFITLLFLLAQVLLIVEFVYAKLKLRYDLKKAAQEQQQQQEAVTTNE